MNVRTLGLALLPLVVSLVGCNSEDKTVSPPEAKTQTITEIVVEGADFSTLETAVIEAGLAGTLQGSGPFTVFAPTNAAFSALPAGALDALLAEPEGDLKNILLYHVVSGSVKASQVVTLTKATTVQGKDVNIEVKDGKVFLNGTTQVTVTDIEASNGIIHVIDGVLLP